MDKRDIGNIVNRYNERLKEHGYSEQALGWTRNNNQLRFEYLIKEWISELSDSNICDFGCGFGDLYGFLNSMNFQNFKYTGIDINKDLVEIGKKAYPNAKFWIGDILNDPLDEKFDFTFSSGVFNHKLEFSDELKFIEQCLDKIASITKKGFAINFLSDKVEYETPNNYNSSPQKILELCYKYTNNIVVRNDYMPFEFTIYVRLDKNVDRTNLIYK